MKKLLIVTCFLCLFCTFSACAVKTVQPVASSDPDVDLTTLSSTMVYGEVYNMMNRPEDYMGKTIKARGPYYSSLFVQTGLYYHFILIEDAAACCQQGLEFIWEGRDYPDGFPANNTQIEVTGVFGEYEELGETYYYLDVDDVTVLNSAE